MKTLKWFSLALLVLGLCAVQVQAQEILCGVGISINDFFVDSPGTPAVNVHVGDELYYIVRVNVPLDNYPITNGEPYLTLPDGTIIDLDDDLALPVGGSSTYDSRNFTGGTYIVDTADMDVNHKVTADADIDAVCDESPDPNELTDAHAEASATIVTAPGTIVTISADPNTGPVGYDTFLEVTETNTGLDDLTGVYVELYSSVDGYLGTLFADTADESIADDDILEVGETMTWSGVGAFTVNELTTFEAYGFGTDPLGNTVTWCVDPGVPPEDTICDQNEVDSVTVDVNCPEPCLSITKVVDCGVSKVGDTVTYTICIENCGSLPLTELIVTDPHLSPDPLEGFPSTLDPEDGLVCVDFEYTIQESDEPGPIENQATVQAIQVCGEEITPVLEDSNIVSVELVHPCLEVDVNCISEGPVVLGGEAAFRITLNNCGDVDLVVDVNDFLGDCDANDLLVPAGQSVSCENIVPVPEDFPEAEICDTVEAHWTISEGGECLTNEDTVTAEGCCQITGNTFCSVTQGYWGNAGGKKCGGQTTTQLLNALLGLGGPVVVGLDGHSITFDTAACIINRLPAGGTPAVLPAGNYNCASLPNSLTKKNKPEINNVLVGQVVTLSLNIRLGALPCLSNDETDSLLGSFVIPEGPFCTAAVGDEDGDIVQVEIDDAFAGWTVDELLALANEALGGADISPYSLSQINGAVTAINEGFDGCRTVVPCPEEDLID